MSSLPQKNINLFGIPSQEKKRPVSSGRLGSSALYQKPEYYKGNGGFPFMKKKNSISSSKQYKKINTNQKGQLSNKKSKIFEGVLMDNNLSIAREQNQKNNNNSNNQSINKILSPNPNLSNNGGNTYKLSNSCLYKSKSDLFAKYFYHKKHNPQLSPNSNKKNPFAKIPHRSYSPLMQSANITFSNSNGNGIRNRNGNSKGKKYVSSSNSQGSTDVNYLNSSFKHKNNSKSLSLPNPLLNQKQQRAVTPILRSKFTLKNIVYNHQGQKIPKPNKMQNKFNNNININHKGIYSSPFTQKNNIHQSKVMGYHSPYQMNRMHSNINVSKSKNIFKHFKGINHNHNQKSTVYTMNINQENDPNFNINTNANTNNQQTNINDNTPIESKDSQSLRLNDQRNIGTNEESKKKNSSVNSQPNNLLIKSQLNSECKKVIKRMHDFSKTGYSGEDEKKVNQDNYFVFKNFVNSPHNMFMAVCDGHGAVGQEISGFLKENLPIDLNKEIRESKKDISHDSIDDIINKIFLNTNDRLSNNEMINSMLSGSTCVSLIYTPTKVITANVGDSRAIVGKFDLNGKWTYLELTIDHKPNDPEEYKRIIAKEGRIEPMRDDDGSFIGPSRVWLKDKEYPGLAMSRSFGDRVAHSVGVCAIPEIKEYKFKAEDRFFILASDGLYEFVTNQEIVDIVKEFYISDDIVGCCEYLYKLSAKRWMIEEQSIDDITMIVVFLEDGE